MRAIALIVAITVIVNLGYEETLCAISVAEATLAFSTSDGTDVQVTREHVVRAVDFLTRMFDALRLKEYRQLSEEEVRLTGGEALDICMDIGDRCLQELAVMAVAGEARTAEELAAKLGVSKETIWRDDFRKLEAHGLIVAVRGLGATITSRGMKLVAFVEGIGRQGASSRVDPVARVPQEVAALVRKLGASGMNHDSIATKLGIPLESVERVLGA